MLQFHSGAETGPYNEEGWSELTTNENIVRDSTVAHTGTYSWLTAGDGISKQSWQFWLTQIVGRWTIIRMWVYLTNLPTAAETLWLAPCVSNGTAVAYLQIGTDGRLSTTTSVGNFYPVQYSPALSIGTWYKLEVAIASVGNQNYEAAIWRLNDVPFARWLGRYAVGSGVRGLLSVGNSSATARTNMDDIFVNDDTGPYANYWNDTARPQSLGRVPPSVRSTATPLTGYTNSVTVNAPPTIVAGDLLVVPLAMSNNGSASVNSVPTGWTLVPAVSSGGGNGGLWLYIKTATGSEPSTYAFGLTANMYWASTCYALTGVNMSNPIIDAQVAGATPSGDTFLVFPGLDLTDSDVLIMQAVSNGQTPAVTPPTNWSSVVGVKDATNHQELQVGVYTSPNGGPSLGLTALYGGSNYGVTATGAVAFASAGTAFVTPPAAPLAERFPLQGTRLQRSLVADPASPALLTSFFVAGAAPANLTPTAAATAAATVLVTVPTVPSLNPGASAASTATATVLATGRLTPTASAVTQATATVTAPGPVALVPTARGTAQATVTVVIPTPVPLAPAASTTTQALCAVTPGAVAPEPMPRWLVRRTMI